MPCEFTMEFIPLRGDILSYCVPDINKCGPSWNVSFGIYVDCQNFNNTEGRCRGIITLSQKEFEDECTKKMFGKKESISFISSFIKFGHLL